MKITNEQFNQLEDIGLTIGQMLENISIMFNEKTDLAKLCFELGITHEKLAAASADMCDTLDDIKGVRENKTLSSRV